MPTFATPAPITVKLDLIAGDVHLTAGDRADTVVTVRPASDREVDVRAAERTRVEYADGTLSVQTPKRRGLLGRISGAAQEGRVQVTVDLPAGSGVRGASALGRMHGEGRLGECRFSTAAGDIELEQTGPLRLDTALGLVSIGSAIGDVEATTAHGHVRIGRIEGSAEIKNLSGPVEIGQITGDLKLTGVNGSLSVDRAYADVTAKTANGSLRIGEVRQGSVSLEATAGSIEVGIREGTSAYLDAHSLIGGVRNALNDADAPAQSDSTVKIVARTHVGTIEVRRSLLGQDS
ncbi:DUF4097 family beta strand repeat-containing protein [Rugosimonospora africana]|uniref:DUF4097 domain-containing protein n=1 Tax=Rugosimonospora africana TaxID=556532 RepID=A0A8J3QZ57_9ACTN|nr:DUF4097 family beta strand repeat-containing protein [Rugosimonospora africana]GIH18563.1 hypothetical protein Raf01_67350 [Rugosimonospora africana]